MNTAISKVGVLALAMLFSATAFAGRIHLKVFDIGPEVSETRELAAGSLAIVDWKGVVTEADKAELAKRADILGFIPDNAFLIRLKTARPGEIARLPFVERLLAYGAEMKIDPQFARVQLQSGIEPVWAFVELAPGTDPAKVAGFFTGSLLAYGKDAYLSRIQPGILWTAAADQNIVWIEGFEMPRLLALTRDELGAKAKDEEPVPAVPPPFTGFESGTKIMNADAAYAAGFNGRGQIVGFGDTGLDKGVMNTVISDFRGQIHTAHAVALGGSSWADPHSHGTHVAGSIAGSGTSSNGGIRGTAWGAKLVVEGMWSDLMNNIFPPTPEVLFSKAYNDGARIHSNSWGRPAAGAYDALARQVDTYLWSHPDFLAVFAAGNDGADMNKNGVIDEGSLGTPATAKNVLTVGASKNLILEGGFQKKMYELRDGEEKWGAEPIRSSMLSEDMRGMAAFSSRGPTKDGRMKPDVVAPGTNIVAARSTHQNANTGWAVYDDNYLYMGGTSMATPLAAGGMAVLRQFLLERMSRESVSAALVKAFAMNSAVDLYPGQFAAGPQQEQPTTRPNVHEGWGRVDLAAAVADTRGTYEFRDEAEGLATGAEYVVEWTNAEAKATPARLTLAYTDAPPAATAQVALVNDLDLELVLPSGAKVYPNRGTAKDAWNNVEAIDLARQEAGRYRLVVRAASVPQGRNGKQPFALVVYR